MPARQRTARLTGLKERSARDLLAALVADGILASDTQKGPVRLHVTVKSLETLFPKLFPKLFPLA